MAYYIRFTNSFQSLFEQGFLLKKENSSNIWLNSSMFHEDLLIVTQNQQMKHWLLQDSSRYFGIASFFSNQCQLSDLVVRQLLSSMNDITSTFNFTKQYIVERKQLVFVSDLRLIIYKYLEQKIKINDPYFKDIVNYLDDSNMLDNQQHIVYNSRLFSFSSSLANLLNEYSMRYDELMIHWSNKKLYFKNNKNEQWQQRLWYDLFGAQDSSFALLGDILRFTLREKLAYAGHIKRIIIVGTPFLPNLIHQFFLHLSQYLDLYYFVYSSIDLFHMSYQYKNFYVQYAGALLEYKMTLEKESLKSNALIIKKNKTSVLHNFQESITFNTPLDITQKDHSLHIIACSDPKREVEILKDYLIDVIQKDNQLELHEICIVMSNTAIYAPYLHLVFQSEHDVSIPIFFDEVLATATLPASYQAIIQLLDLAGSRFKQSQIMDLIQNQSIVENLAIDEDEQLIWIEFCKKYHVAWGFNGHHRAKEVPGSGEEFSWLTAFYHYLDDYMHNLDNGSLFVFTHVQAIGRLIHFVHQLYDSFYDLTNRQYTLSDWIEFLEPTLAQFLSDGEARNGRIKLFRSLHEISLALNNLEHLQYDNGLLPFVIIVQLLKEAMEREAEGEMNLASKQGILCAPIFALRVIPFKIVAFLGMNEDLYPSRERANSSGYSLSDLFDQAFIMKKSNNERSGFLETFLCAQDYVWIFYQHKDRETGQNLELSSVVYDLFFEVSNDKNFYKNFIYYYPLHSFHHSLFSSSQLVSTYSSEALQKARSFYDFFQKSSKKWLNFTAVFNNMVLNSLDLDSLVNFIWSPLEYAIDYHTHNDWNAHKLSDDDLEYYVLPKKLADNILNDVWKHLLITRSNKDKLSETLEEIWHNNLKNKNIVHNPYLERHYQQYKNLSNIMINKFFEEDYCYEWQLKSVLEEDIYLNNTIDNHEADPISVRFKINDVYVKSISNSEYYQYKIKSYVFKNKENINWRERIKEYLVNSLWNLDDAHKKLFVHLGEFTLKKDTNSEVVFDISRNLPNEQFFLTKSSFLKLISYYWSNLKTPIAATSTMWLKLLQMKIKREDLLENYKLVSRESISQDEKLIQRLALFNITDECLAERNISSGEQEMLMFLWNNFFDL